MFHIRYNNEHQRLTEIPEFQETRKTEKGVNDHSSKYDLLIHCGDITCGGSEEEVLEFDSFLALHMKKFFKKIIIVPGNHDGFLEDSYDEESGEMKFKFRNGICLVNEVVECFGLKIFALYSKPPENYLLFRSFQYEEKEKVEKVLEKLTDDIDIAVFHGPPYGIRDKVIGGKVKGSIKNCGCEILRKKILEVQPRVFVNGHLHEEYGCTKVKNCRTVFVNASFLTKRHRKNKPVNYPLFCDIEV